MPAIMALSCPVCGGPLNPADEKCNFCGSYIVIKTDLPKLDRRALNQAVIQEHITDFRRRVRSNTYDEEAHYGLGIAYFSLGLIDEAVDELSQAARLMPENPHIQAQLAVALYESFKAGNTSSEQLMNTRIQNALLLDPDHLEATMLKAEVLLDKQHYGEGVQLYKGLMPIGKERVRAKLQSALADLCDHRLASQQWSGAQWCWQTLAPVDSDAAKALAVRFLNMHKQLVPRNVRNRTNDLQNGGSMENVSSSGKFPRPKSNFYWTTFFVAVLGLLLGFIQLIAISSRAGFREVVAGTGSRNGDSSPRYPWC